MQSKPASEPHLKNEQAVFKIAGFWCCRNLNLQFQGKRDLLSAFQAAACGDPPNSSTGISGSCDPASRFDRSSVWGESTPQASKKMFPSRAEELDDLPIGENLGLAAW
ncbi:hypothetical protein [Bradyrhizobium sp. WSM1743]|uniref:hypothetical protein n=1 Tax=Bradyrhizobium sp. WSM1743 TaxID=318996 RepID=UPI0012EC2682|nr:hypothetical protein [Bradyrhizobium sp. WSM1743]